MSDEPITSEWEPDTPDPNEDDDHQPGWLTYTIRFCPACKGPDGKWSVTFYSLLLRHLVQRNRKSFNGTSPCRQ